MERIQSAIAKARAQRHGQIGQAAPAGQAVPPTPRLAAADTAPPSAPASAAPQVDAAWAALKPVTLDPALMQHHRVVAFAGGPDATPYGVLRTRVLQQARQNGWKRIGITSPSAGCGKTTTALNLGFSLARQPETRTVLAEIDMRRPAFVRMLGAQGEVSFAEVLQGSAALADAALRHGGNLAIAPVTRIVRNPAELLHASSVPAALERIEADYAPDLMIFDMPPLLVSDDAMVIAGQMDAVLLIAAADATSIRQVDICERELAAQTNVMGTILNKCRYLEKDDGYGYGYGY